MWKRLLSGLQREREGARLPTAQLAAAVLLLECVRADFAHSEPELAAVREALQTGFGLDEATVEQLMHEGKHEAQQAVSLHAYVAKLNRELDPGQRRAMVAMLWRVAWADGRLDPQEEHLLRQLADLLHVPHGAMIQEKLAARRPET